MAGVLALSSLLTPFCLGTVIGSVVTGRAGAHGDPASSWVNSMSLLTGALFGAVTAYLTAVYLTVDSERGGEHGLRAVSPGALAAGVLSGILAAVTMAVPGLEQGPGQRVQEVRYPGRQRVRGVPDRRPHGHGHLACVRHRYGVIANTFPKIYIGLSKAG